MSASYWLQTPTLASFGDGLIYSPGDVYWNPVPAGQNFGCAAAYGQGTAKIDYVIFDLAGDLYPSGTQPAVSGIMFAPGWDIAHAPGRFQIWATNAYAPCCSYGSTSCSIPGQNGAAATPWVLIFTSAIDFKFYDGLPIFSPITYYWPAQSYRWWRLQITQGSGTLVCCSFIISSSHHLIISYEQLLLSPPHSLLAIFCVYVFAVVVMVVSTVDQ